MISWVMQANIMLLSLLRVIMYLESPKYVNLPNANDENGLLEPTFQKIFFCQYKIF